MLEGLDYILFILTAVAVGFVGSVLSFWVWSRPLAEETVEADRRAVIGRWLIVASACSACFELVTGGFLADWAGRILGMETGRASHAVLLIFFSVTAAILMVALFVVRGNRTWAGRRVRIASIALLVISGIGSGLFLAVHFYGGS